MASEYGQYVQMQELTGTAPGHLTDSVMLYASGAANEASTTQLYMKDSAGTEYVIGGSWNLEDGDGTELAITGGAQLKFVEGGAIDINWSDTSHGIDGDEYDMTFTLDIVGLSATTTVDDADLVVIDDGAGGTLRKMTRAHFIESAALDAINIDGGAIDGTAIGANSAAAGTFTAVVGTSLSVSDGNITNVGDIALDTISGDNGSSFAMGTNWTNAGRTVADAGILTTVDINGGSIDGTAIGAASAAAGTFAAIVGTSAVVNGNAAVSGTLHATDDTQLQGTLEVVGASSFEGAVTAQGTLTVATSVLPDAAGGADLGSTSAEWGDLYIADDKKIKFGSGQDATIEYDEDGTDELRFAGAAVTFEQAVTFDANVTLGDAAGDVTTVTGKLSGSNGLAVTGDATFSSKVTVQGDLDVQGAVNTITNHETELHIADKVILIASGTSKNDGAAALGALDQGGLYLGSTGSLAVASIVWDAGNDRWHTPESMHVSGAMLVGGASSLNGDVDLGDATGDTITATGRFDSDLVPSTDSARDLGTSALQWAEAHVDHGHIDTITATGTSTLTTVDINGGNIDGTAIGAASPSTIVGTTVTVNTRLVPDSAGGADLGSTSAEWGDLYIADDKKIYFGSGQDASLEYDEDGTDTLLYAGASMRFSDDTKLEFGAGGDASFEYDEDGTDTLLYAGASMRFSDDIKLEFGTGGDASFEYDEDGNDVLLYAGANMRFGDDIKLEFGAGGDATIEYDEDGDDELKFAGAAVAFAQAVSFDANVTLGNAASDITTVTGKLSGSNGALISGDFVTIGTTGLSGSVAFAGGYTANGDYGMSFNSANGNLVARGAVTADGGASFGGGYGGGTGASISSAGVIQMNSNLTCDGTATFAGGYGSTGVSISAAGAVSANGVLTVANTVSGAAGQFTSIDIGGSNQSGYALAIPNNADDSGKAIAHAWRTYSSERYKTNIKTIETPIATLSKLRGVTYDWKGNGAKDVGFIAEEVGKIIPEVVDFEENGTDATSMDYSRLTAILVEAVKEQQATISSLKSAVAKLASQHDEIDG